MLLYLHWNVCFCLIFMRHLIDETWAYKLIILLKNQYLKKFPNITLPRDFIITKFKETGAHTVAQWVKLLPLPSTSHSTSLSFGCSASAPVPYWCTWKCNRGGPECLVPCYPHGRPERNSWLLPLAWISPDCHGRFGNETVERKTLTLWLFLSVTLCFR